jgi:hypothetical protein
MLLDSNEVRRRHDNDQQHPVNALPTGSKPDRSKT